MPIVEFATLAGRRILINTRREATSIMVDGVVVLNYDREGRMTGAWIDGRNYRRSLDNRVIEKQSGSQPGLAYRVRRELPDGEAQAFLHRVFAMLTEFRNDAFDPASQVIGDVAPDDVNIVRDAIDHVLECTPERLEQDRETYPIIYKPVSILPPDQYLALVLQATEGCSFNHCAFCSFYRDRKFRVKHIEEFKHHIRDVRTFFGGAITLRKSIFLADANALVVPQEQLIPIFDAINADFALHPRGLDYDALKKWEAQHPIHFDGVYSFIDAFATRRKSAHDYAELAARGLRRVYIGLESGDAELLGFLGKPNSPEDVLQLVCHLKAGGVAVSMIILAGAGGEKYAAQHIVHTADLINQMPLDKNDLIYFSELVDFEGSDYSTLARDAGIRPLTVEEIEHQMAQMRAAFKFGNLDNAPKISYYDIREFIY